VARRWPSRPTADICQRQRPVPYRKASLKHPGQDLVEIGEGWWPGHPVQGHEPGDRRTGSPGRDPSGSGQLPDGKHELAEQARHLRCPAIVAGQGGLTVPQPSQQGNGPAAVPVSEAVPADAGRLSPGARQSAHRRWLSRPDLRAASLTSLLLALTAALALFSLPVDTGALVPAGPDDALAG
jgi:hypothetical protein